MRNLSILLALIFLLSACGAVTPFVPTPIATLTATPSPTRTATSTITPSPTITPTPIPLEEATRIAFETARENVCPTTTPAPERNGSATILADAQILREFAGVYTLNHGMGGMKVVLNCDGTFIEAYYYDSPYIFYAIGLAFIENGQIQFKYSKSKSPTSTWSVFPVRWGQRKYLIRTDAVMEFCKEIESKDVFFHEPRVDPSWGAFLLRIGDENLDAPAFPIYPSGEKVCP